MPFPNEHAGRLRNPNDFNPETFRRTSGGKLYNRIDVPSTVDIIWGKLKDAAGKDDPVLPQTLRFPVTSWTVAEAKKWIKENNINVILFEEASKDNVKKMETVELVEAFETLGNQYAELKKNNNHNLFNVLIMLKWVYDECRLRKEIILNKEVLTEDIKKAIDVIEGKEDLRNVLSSDFRNKTIENISKGQDKHFEIKLQVIDKESTEVQGITKYHLGYALDSSVAFEGNNIIKAGTIETMALNVRTDDNVIVLVNKIKPVMVENKIGIQAEKMFIKCEGNGKKPNSAKEIIKIAHENKKLDLNKEMAIQLSKCKIINIDPASEFGIDMNKMIPFIKADKFGENGIVYGIVYANGEVDTDGDYATEEEIRKACWKFMEKYQKMNLMHSQALSNSSYSIVECAVAFSDFRIGGQTINKGDWYIAVKVKDSNLKKMIESGELNSFSMEGKAKPGKPIPEMERKKRMAA